jgi:hypothetical protein
MIQLRDDIVWVREADGRLSPFSEGRLAVSIHRAAKNGGESDPLLAEAVAAAVREFIGAVHPDAAIERRDLASLVASILAALGYTKISTAYLLRQRRAEINLARLAGETESGIELDFFRRLDLALAELGEPRTRRVQITGLRECVLKLKRAQRWTQACSGMADEIVAFVRGRAARIHAQASSGTLDVTVKN